jgi:hypothetical protein
VNQERERLVEPEPLSTTMSSQAQTVGAGNAFTWINVEDQDATRRVKSLAIRDYRRKQKVEAAKYQNRKKSAVQRTILSAAHSTKTQELARNFEPVPVLVRQVGNNIDPFNLFPAELNSHRDRSLAHHCKSWYLHRYKGPCTL